MATRQTTKEQVAFLVGAAVFLWALVKIAIFFTRPATPPGTPMAPLAEPQPGDAALSAFLATRGLDSYLERGIRDPFFPDASQPAQVFVRAAIAHSFIRSTTSTGYGVISSYTFDCRMTPHPVRELRLNVPTGLNVVGVFSKELDDTRKWGLDGGTLVVPVNPDLLRRAYYRCQIAVKAQAPVKLPSVWTAPVLAFGDATPNVHCEVGHIAVATPGESVEITPRESPQSLLTRIALETVPKELAASSNKFAWFFRQPTYNLTLELKSTTHVVTRPDPKQGPVVKSKDVPEPKIKGTDTTTKEAPEPKEEPKKLDIPRVADADSLPFKLTAILRIHEPEPRRQAVLRDKTSGEYYRKFEGDTIADGLKIVSISDDAVVVADAAGKHYKFAGRFADAHNLGPK